MKLTKEEKGILKAVNNGEFKPLPESEVEKFRQAARWTLSKDTRINVRLNKEDLEKIKKKAQHEGLPYQTLVASILHKYAAHSIIDLTDLVRVKKILSKA